MERGQSLGAPIEEPRAEIQICEDSSLCLTFTMASQKRSSDQLRLSTTPSAKRTRVEELPSTDEDQNPTTNDQMYEHDLSVLPSNPVTVFTDLVGYVSC